MLLTKPKICYIFIALRAKYITQEGCCIMKKINYLGFLSLLSLLAILGYSTGNTGLYGFLGFLYYARYFFVIPDELFVLNLRKACTTAFLTELIALVPLMFATHAGFIAGKPIPASFGLSFAAAIFAFTIHLLILEHRESRGSGLC